MGLKIRNVAGGISSLDYARHDDSRVVPQGIDGGAIDEFEDGTPDESAMCLVCPHESCGGCADRETSYAEQLTVKDAVVRTLMEAMGLADVYLGITAGSKLTAYRNKMDYTFGDEFKGGPLTLGMHRRKSFMSVVTTSACRLVHEDFNKLLVATLGFCTQNGYAAYNKKSHKGLLRNLILRRGVRTNELLVNIVTSSQGFFDEAAYLETVLGLPLENGVCGVLRTVNDNVADFIYPEEIHVLAGRDYYMEDVLDLKFKVNAFSFFQTNVEAAERLYVEALDWIDDLTAKSVHDLYCGAGTISQVLARRADAVVGVEISADAVGDAIANARMNGLENCRFVRGDVLETLERIRAGSMPAPDILVVDPPRAGIHPRALRAITEIGTREMVYISCNPKSCAENLKVLQEAYNVTRFKAFDNFPFTGHVEAAAHLELKRR